MAIKHLLYAKVTGENNAGHERKGDKERKKEIKGKKCES
jgi:hypothetical protein